MYMYNIIVTLFYYFLSSSFRLYIDLSSFYGSVRVDVGSNATFHCEGGGSYLYWFINGVNTEDMTAEEIEKRGMSFSGYLSSILLWL